MPNFKKKSKFDDGESPPPLGEYQDWTKKDTRVITEPLNNLPADYVLSRLEKKYKVVEVLIGGLKAEECGKLIVRVRK